jgi:hypothetical protein
MPSGCPQPLSESFMKSLCSLDHGQVMKIALEEIKRRQPIGLGWFRLLSYLQVPLQCALQRDRPPLLVLNPERAHNARLSRNRASVSSEKIPISAAVAARERICFTINSGCSLHASFECADFFLVMAISMCRAIRSAAATRALSILWMYPSVTLDRA